MVSLEWIKWEYIVTSEWEMKGDRSESDRLKYNTKAVFEGFYWFGLDLII